jgi:hypothetical protein
LISITHKTNLNKQTYMKKYLITLAAMTLAIGGSINFVGCGGEEVTPAPPNEPGVTLTDEDKADAEKEGYNAGPAGGSTPEAGGGKKED